MMCLIMTDRGWAQLGDGVVCVNHNNLQGVYRPDGIGDAKEETWARAFSYFMDAHAYLEGNLSKEQIFRAFDRSIFGAFGERL